MKSVNDIKIFTYDEKKKAIRVTQIGEDETQGEHLPLAGYVRISRDAEGVIGAPVFGEVVVKIGNQLRNMRVQCV